MTADPPPPPPEDPDQGSGHGLDVDAAFAEIVRRFSDAPHAPDATASSGAAPGDDEVAASGRGDDSAPEARPRDAGADDSATDPDSPSPAAARPSDPDSLRGLFAPAWSDPLQSEANWADEGHFIPPPPPPLPFVEPRRLVAWIGLFGGPALALVAIVLGFALPRWFGFALSLAFVGGFVYLVATMTPTRDDGSGGDDGAVL